MKRPNTKEIGQRPLRVGEQVRHALDQIMRRGHFRDPELASAHVTFTEVRLGPDLKHATAFVTTLGGQDRNGVIAALNRASAYFRGQVAHAVRLKYAPTISFQADISFDRAAAIDALLHDPRVERDLHPDDDDAGDKTNEEDQTP